MLEKPELSETKIAARVLDAYGLQIADVAFLPLGADSNTAVYRLMAADKTSYFLKLRSGVFDVTSVMLPKFLSEQGITQIIAALTTLDHQLWTTLDDFTVTLYPFVEGRNGFDLKPTDSQWLEFAAALKTVHSSKLPETLKSQIRHETFTPKWRGLVKSFMQRVEVETFADPTSVKLAALLKAKRAEIMRLIAQAECLAAALQRQSPEFVLCHSDIHAWNILIDTSGALYIVDWDDPILAPKERDLMFVGAGLGICDSPAQEALFYQGYGQAEINCIALAYYRCERIVQDIAAYCEQILLNDEGGEDREAGLQQLTIQFLPDEVVERAFKSEKLLPSELRFYAHHGVTLRI
jgi:spectinomycin phosphotransferase